MLSNQLIFFIVFCVGFLLKIKFIYILTFFLSNLHFFLVTCFTDKVKKI